MKIGILTFHRAYNYGAFLQSFALSREIARHGHQVEIIDFTPSSLLEGYKPIKFFDSKMIETNNPILFYVKDLVYKLVNYQYINNKNSFDAIRNSYIWGNMDSIPLSPGCVFSDDINEFKKYVDDKYDMIIVGSDAVWNDYQTKCPFIYYLDNIYCKYKVSYAVSAYGMSYERKNTEQIEYLSKLLKEFNLIACRDEYTENAVRQISNKNVFHSCDPTLFLEARDFDDYANSAKEKLINAGVDFSKKLVFLMGDSKVGRLAKDALSGKFMLIGVYNYNQYADVNISNLTPFEWAASFRYFEFTITSYFHCSILSLINGIPAVAVDKMTAFSTKNKSKIKDLFERLGTMDLYYTSDLSEEDLLKASYTAIKKRNDTNYRKVLYSSILSERKTGSQFLKKIDSI